MFQHLSHLGRGRGLPYEVHSRLQFVRCQSQGSVVKPPSLPNLIPRSEPSTKSTIRRRVFYRFYDFVHEYATLPFRVLPDKFLSISRQFVQGSKLLFRDMAEFVRVYDVLASTSHWSKACKTLQRRQLELYQSLPVELYKVAPILVISAFPLMQNVAFPLALLYPKHLLSTHFLRPEQRLEMERSAMEKRQIFYRPLFRDLQRGLIFVRGMPFYQPLKRVYGTMAQGGQPSLADLVDIKAQFSQGGIYEVSKLYSHHVRHLMKVHGVSYFLFWRSKLLQYANILLEIDLALQREGLDTLDNQGLKQSCQMRGFLIEEHTTREEMILYLRDWIAISSQLDATSASLILHLPILLGYNKDTRVWDANSIS